MNSSTSNSKIEAPENVPEESLVSWRSVTRSFFWALGLVILLEIGLHIGQERLFSSEVAGDFRSDSIWESLQIVQSDPTPNLIVVGSSVSNGVKASALVKGGERGENLVLFSANAHGVRRLLNEVVFPSCTPQRIVYVVSPRDWNAQSNVDQVNSQIPDLDLYTQNPSGYATQMFFQQHLYLFRYRDVLADWARHPREFLGAVKGAVQAPVEKKTKPLKRIFKSLRVNARSYEDLSAIHAASLAKNAKLFVVCLPVNPSPKATSEQFRRDEHQWRQSMRAFCRQRQIDFVDLSTVVSDARFFRDTHHLNQQGQQRATDYVRATFANPEK